jgi:hypothetical protein
MPTSARLALRARGLAASQTSSSAQRRSRSGRSRRGTDLVIAGELRRDPGAAPRRRQHGLKGQCWRRARSRGSGAPCTPMLESWICAAPDPRDPSLGEKGAGRGMVTLSYFRFPRLPRTPFPQGPERSARPFETGPRPGTRQYVPDHPRCAPLRAPRAPRRLPWRGDSRERLRNPAPVTQHPDPNPDGLPRCARSAKLGGDRRAKRGEWGQP